MIRTTSTDSAPSLRDLRRKSGLSQRDVAASLDVSQQAVGDWERGVSRPRPEKVDGLALLFQVSLEDIDSAVTAARLETPSRRGRSEVEQLRRRVGELEDELDRSNRLLDFEEQKVKILTGAASPSEKLRQVAALSRKQVAVAHNANIRRTD